MPRQIACSNFQGFDSWRVVFDNEAFEPGMPDPYHDEWVPFLYNDERGLNTLEEAHSGAYRDKRGDGEYHEGPMAYEGLPVGWRLSVLSHDLDAAIYSARVHPLIEITTEI